MPTVVISPFNVANYPGGSGHFWVYMQYVLGFLQLGCEVWWLEAFRSKGHALQKAADLDVFRKRLQHFGLGKRMLLYRVRSNRPFAGVPADYLGVTREEAESVFERADLLLNFHYSVSPGLLSRFRRTALVDIDPGLLQFWIDRGQLSVPEHDCYFTIGENVGRSGGIASRDRMSWIRLRPAVSLEKWPCAFDPDSKAFTTVSSWDSSDWIVNGDEVYENTKRVAFMKFAQLPRLTGQPLELALFLRSERDMDDRKFLEQQGWRIRHAGEVASTPESYQAYIQSSRGEFSCAKPAYIHWNTAWVSDRTVCYLASGKPVVVQHTGPSAYLPDGEGMFRVKSPEEAARALDVINGDYERHCRAARRLAEEFFDASQVAAQILASAL